MNILVVGTTLFEDPVFAAGFVLAGVTLAETVLQPESGTADFNSCWGYPLSQITGGSFQSSNMADFEMTPMLFILYNEIPETADTYGNNGYMGMTGNVVAVKNGMAWAGSFFPINGQGQ